MSEEVKEVSTKMDLDILKKRPLSQSSLKQFLKSPMHFIHYRTEPFFNC